MVNNIRIIEEKDMSDSLDYNNNNGVYNEAGLSEREGIRKRILQVGARRAENNSKLHNEKKNYQHYFSQPLSSEGVVKK